MLSAVLDSSYSEMHQAVNSSLIKALSAHTDLLIVGRRAQYGALLGRRVRQLQLRHFSTEGRDALSARVLMLANTLLDRVALARTDADRLLVFGYDVIAFAFASPFYHGLDVCLFHHRQVDELHHRFKRRCFGVYMNRVKHVVFADYIKAFLVDTIGVDADRVWVIPHPRWERQVTAPVVVPAGPRTLVGLSYSNDEGLISEIITIERTEGILAQSGVRLLLKSKHSSFSSPHLEVITGALPRAEYDRCFASAAGVVVLLGEQFVHRISGLMIDALSVGKRVIGTDVRSLREYATRYPTLITVCHGAREILQSIASGTPADAEAFDHFRRDHSLECVSAHLGPLFEPGQAGARCRPRP